MVQSSTQVLATLLLLSILGLVIHLLIIISVLKDVSQSTLNATFWFTWIGIVYAVIYFIVCANAISDPDGMTQPEKDFSYDMQTQETQMAAYAGE